MSIIQNASFVLIAAEPFRRAKRRTYNTSKAKHEVGGYPLQAHPRESFPLSPWGERAGGEKATQPNVTNLIEKGCGEAAPFFFASRTSATAIV